MLARRIILTVAFCLININVVFGITLKLGSIAPDGSPWDRAVKKIAYKWYNISNGEVEIKIYPGGIVGDEADMIRKMRINQLQSALLTQLGMGFISPELLSLNIPMLVDNDAEVDFLLEKLKPEFNNYLHKKGFKVISWAKVGWITFFSKHKVVTPEDLKKHKLAVATNEPNMLQAWRVLGFNAIPLSTNDTLAGLQSGMVDAFYGTPLVAATFQWFALAPNMCTLKVAPLIGGFVITNRTWSKVPDKYKEQFMEAAREVLVELYSETRRLEEEAIVTMQKNGLKINIVLVENIRKWKIVAKRGHDAYIGKSFPKSFLEKMNRYLREYRSR